MPDAGLVFQSISAADGSLAGIPEDPGVLYGAAYDAGARVHSNSYGSDAAGEYDVQAMLLDRFMAAHPDMLITFSAGNAGTDADANGVIDPGSIGSPATAKSTLSVGASEDQRGPAFTSGSLAPGVPAYSTYAVFYVPPAGPPIENDFMSNNSQGMVAFSSRGPTRDGRIKPDVVGIGTHVLSTKSTLIDNADVFNHYWGLASEGSSLGNPLLGDYPKSADAYYAWNGGTSMSNPLVAGAAVDVRQYLRQVRGFGSPSAALMKAALTAGADELTGQYDPVHRDVTARPDNNEGWGRVDVANTIDPDGATKVAFFDDPVGLRTGAAARYTFKVTDPSVPLRAQLAWTDEAGNPVAAKTLVNDLDLVVTAPNGTVYRGNVFDPRSGSTTASAPNAPKGNRVDTVEGVMVPSPAAGVWTIDVKGFTVPAAPQKFALVARGGFSAQSAGALHLDAAAYRSGGRPVQIVVNDPGASDSVTATVHTTSAPGGVTVTIPLADGQQGTFTGHINIGGPNSAPSSTSLPGNDGDEIVVDYLDSAGTTRTATARVDNRKPVVSATATKSVTPFSAAMTFHTDEKAIGRVDAGGQPDKAALTISGSDGVLVNDHKVNVGGLDGGKRYYYRSAGIDDPGNVGVDNYAGSFYTFRTPFSTVEYTYDAETEGGWTHQTNTDNASAAADAWHLTSRADAVHAGSKAWLYGPEKAKDNYQPSSDAFLDSPTITRHAPAWSTLELYANYDTEKGFDGLNFFASGDGGSSYRLLPLVSIGAAGPPALASAQIDGNSGGFRLLTFDLSSFKTPTLKLRVQFTSDTGVEYGGAAVDDFIVRGSQVAPVAASASFTGTSTSARRGTTTAVAGLTLTPDRDYVRGTRVVVRRTGNATDKDVTDASLLLPNGRVYTAHFVDGVATFDKVAIDSSSAAPSAVEVRAKVAKGAVVGRTFSLTVDPAEVVLAVPDTIRTDPPTTAGPITIKS